MLKGRRRVGGRLSEKDKLRFSDRLCHIMEMKIHKTMLFLTGAQRKRKKLKGNQETIKC